MKRAWTPALALFALFALIVSGCEKKPRTAGSGSPDLTS